MLVPTGFSSWSNYLNFALARKFVATDSQMPVEIDENWLQKIGHGVSRPFLNPLNFLLREIKNPLVILVLTVSLIAIVTLVFYPFQFMVAACRVFPFLAYIQPWMVKLALYIGVEATIGAIGLRALGRMCNPKLRKAWQNQKIVPMHIGAKTF